MGTKNAGLSLAHGKELLIVYHLEQHILRRAEAKSLDFKLGRIN